MLLQSCLCTVAIAVNVTVITQPNNTTVCEGRTAVFTCVMDILNVNISTVNIRWWRIIIDHNSSPLPITEAVKRYTISNNINEHRVTSALMITDVRLVDMGPYWPGLTDDNQLCSMAFLSVVLQNGICMCVSYVYYVRMYLCSYMLKIDKKEWESQSLTT